MAEVCCIGGMTLDRTLKLDESAVMASSNPATMRTAPGGVARNVAENLARLSVATSLFSQVGDDEHGREAVAATARAGVDVSQVQAHPSLPTGSYTAIVQPDGQLLVGAADLGACEAMDADWLDTLWPSISAARIVFADANLAPGVLEQLIKRTRGTDVELAINLVSVAKARRLPPDLNGIDLLFCNLDEARAVTGGADDAGEAAAALGEVGVGAAIVTAGADGAWLAGAGQTRHCPRPQATWSTSPAPVTHSSRASCSVGCVVMMRWTPVVSASQQQR